MISTPFRHELGGFFLLPAYRLDITPSFLISSTNIRLLPEAIKKSMLQTGMKVRIEEGKSMAGPGFLKG
jgi:hypothetical protein